MAFLTSMTGFGSATAAAALTTAGDDPAAHATVSVEVRTVNARFLDLHFRIPDECRHAETLLREKLTAALARGKVDCRVHLQLPASLAASAAPDPQAIAQIDALQRAVTSALPAAVPLSVAEILRWPGVLAQPSLSPAALADAVAAAADAAIAQLCDARMREGAALGAMLRERVAAMRAIVATLQPLVPQLVAAHQVKLNERLAQALAATDGDGAALSRDEIAERIRQEVVLYGIRLDVAEELSRLVAHLDETDRIVGAGGVVGKRLDFMMQELNREANTLGSKAAAQQQTDAAMELKLLIEQMREQVQNLE